MPDSVGAEAHSLVRVRAAGRLHLGFLDPSGTLGRAFGSVGLAISGFETDLQFAPARVDAIVADDQSALAESERAAALLERLRERSGLVAPLRLRLRGVLPAHAGLGSGTQLALALGRAFARFHGIDPATPLLASWLGRGRRSGIGIAGFEHGGLIVDGGPGADGGPAPLLSRVGFPEAWRVIVVLDATRRGLAGDAERAAIAALPPMARSDAADLCHQVLLRVLPGAACADFDAFAAGVNRLQQRLGEHFAPAQGGSAWTSQAVGRALEWMRAHAGADRVAIGQSSWGPTGFGFTASEDDARALADAATRAGVIGSGLELRIVGGRNEGARITTIATR